MTFASTEGKCKREDERKANAKIADERKAAENAKPGSILAENLASQFPDDSRALLANARK